MADGTLVAHVIRSYLPQKYRFLVQLHNYVDSNQTDQKRINWQLLNKRVLGKIPL